MSTCGSVSESRSRSIQEDDRSCEPPPPQEDASQARLREGREAEQRPSEWASGEPAGPPREGFERAQREKNARLAEHTARVDKPVTSDPIGNAAVSIIAGAVVGGFSVAASGVRAIAHHVAEHVAIDVGAELVEHGAHHAAEALAPQHGATHGSEAHGTVSQPDSGGKTTGDGRCAPADPPGGSSPAPPPGGDKIPYAPGQAPLRIPEAPMVIAG